MTEAKSHSACYPLVICVRQNYNLVLLAAARIIRAMQTKNAFSLALKIAVMLLIMKLICSFIAEPGLVYIFWSFLLVCIRLTAGIVLIPLGVICVGLNYNFVLLAAARIIRAMQTKNAFSLALKIAVMLLIMKLICSFIAEQGLVYIFWSFLLVCFRLTAGIVLILAGVAFVSGPKNETERLSPNDSRTGEYIRAISFLYMIVYFTFNCPVFPTEQLMTMW